jgi:predicted dinucleotide-binding enzyme
MQIGIIGTGNVGSALGKRWAAAGHTIVFGTRDPGSAKVKSLVSGIGPKARAGRIAEAATFGEVVVLATPFGATEDAIRQAGNLSGKVVVDCTNPLKPDFSGLTVGHTTSAGESVAGWARAAKVVKALNSTGAGNMVDPRYGSECASMFVCGDDASAKATVSDLVRALGFDVVDAGPLVNARLLEPLAMLWITLAYGLGQGPNIAFRLLRR